MTYTYTTTPPAGITINASGIVRCTHAVANSNFCCTRCRELSPQILTRETLSIWATEAEVAAFIPTMFSMERQIELLQTPENAKRIYQELEVRLGYTK